MEFDRIKTEIKAADFDQTRIDDENYFEAVIRKIKIAGMIGILENLFGPPAWPSKTKLSKEAESAIKNFGGLRRGQTLYFLKTGDRSIFAMIWPWQDGERVTIKIAKV